jgi:hypothetical protein
MDNSDKIKLQFDFNKRTIIVITSNYNKFLEFEKLLCKYAIQSIQEINTKMTISEIFDKYNSEGFTKILSLITEETKLLYAGTNILCDLTKSAVVDHKSTLSVYTIENKDSNDNKTRQINIKTFEHRTNGLYNNQYLKNMIDNTTSDSKKRGWGWDFHFYIKRNGKTYADLGENKNSAREVVLSEYLKTFKYKIMVQMKGLEYKHERPLDFNSASHVRQLYVNDVNKYPKLVNLGIAKIISKVFENGIAFIAPYNLQERVCWMPPINPIPFNEKKTIRHGLTFLFHDFGHFVFKPDLVFTTDSKINRFYYIVCRMMSEATTIFSADGVNAHAIRDDYENINDRKIYPLYRVLGFDMDNITCDDIKKLMHASVKYCLLDDDSGFVDLINKNLVNNSDRENALKASLAPLEEYKKKYEAFFTGDYRWTVENLNGLVKQSDQLVVWYKSVSELNNKFDLGIKSVDEFKTEIKPIMDEQFQFPISFSLENDDIAKSLINIHYRKLIDVIFDFVFENNIKHYFENNDQIDTTDDNFDADKIISKNNIMKAFIKYMCNQLFVFEKFRLEYADEWKTIIINELKSLTQDEFNHNDIDRIREIYRIYLENCMMNHIISRDEYDVYNEIFHIIKPTYINYDKETTPLKDICMKSLLDC